VSNPEKLCSVGFGAPSRMANSILRVIGQVRRSGTLPHEPEQRFFRLAPPSEHEQTQVQARRCAVAILVNECPGFRYHEINPHSYEIIPKVAGEHNGNV
jgi:hypothetical protein